MTSSCAGRFAKRTLRPVLLGAVAALAACDDLGGTVNDGGAGDFTRTIRASTDEASGEAGSPSSGASVSGDGRFVAFVSHASLVPEDADSLPDVYVKDTVTRRVVLASRADGPLGSKGNGSSLGPSISADGRRVAFQSTSTNLHPQDADAHADIYVRDLDAHATVLVSRADGPAGAKGNGPSTWASMSGDGRHVAFQTQATNLHPEDTDTFFDVFVRTLATDGLVLAGRRNDPQPGVPGAREPVFEPSLSFDGSRIAFLCNSVTIHPDASTSIGYQAYVRDLAAGTTTLVSRADGPAGAIGNDFTRTVKISGDGTRVAFVTFAFNVAPLITSVPTVVVRDLPTATNAAAAVSDGVDGLPVAVDFSLSLSGDGRRVAFVSAAPSLVLGDTNRVKDVFIRDLDASATWRASVRTFGAQGSKASGGPSMSADGRWVAFQSDAPDLVDDDANEQMDVFVRGPLR